MSCANSVLPMFMTILSPRHRRGEPPAIQIRPSNEVPKSHVCQWFIRKLGSTNRTLVGPPSVQPADNEMIWFAKDASGSTFAIDGLFTDFTTESRFTGPPGAFRSDPASSIAKILEVDMTYFEPSAEKPPATPSAPKL